MQLPRHIKYVLKLIPCIMVDSLKMNSFAITFLYYIFLITMINLKQEINLCAPPAEEYIE